MSKRRLLFSEADAGAEVNLSPLIDVVFILLIFFIVTTVFVEESGVEVERPQSATAVSLEKNSILIAITEDNRIYYAGEEVGVRGVRPLVKRLLGGDDKPVIVQADRRASVEMYTRVHDEAMLAGAKTINLATRK